MIDFQYNKLVETILRQGEEKEDRTGTGTLSIFDYHIEYNMQQGANPKGPLPGNYKAYARFPLLSSKKINFNNVMHELNFFLRGDTNLKDLKAPQIWAPWARKSGGLGPVYGYQWRFWEDRDIQGVLYIDQIKELITNLKENPHSRRHLVSAWNVADLERMVLRPCHWAFEIYISNKDTLNLKWHQRSVDVAVGLPYNIASYALLLKMLAKECGYKEGTLIGDLTNVHIYKSHVEKIQEQITRPYVTGPELIINPTKTFWQLVEEDTPR